MTNFRPKVICRLVFGLSGIGPNAECLQLFFKTIFISNYTLQLFIFIIRFFFITFQSNNFKFLKQIILDSIFHYKGICRCNKVDETNGVRKNHSQKSYF